MVVIIEPSAIGGTIRSPRSKSSMQRACAAALLHQGVSEIHHPGFSNDDRAALDVIQKLGAEWTYDGEKIIVTSRGVSPVSDTLNCGESGLGIRMFTPIAALSRMPLRVTGSGSLVSRPMHFFDEILPQLGVEIQTQGGRLPFDLRGPLKPADITVDGSLSSQFLTGLLMAFSAADAEQVTITVNKLTSRGYIDLTLEVMRAFGMRVPENRDYQQFYFGSQPHEPGHTKLQYTVEGDWSGAAFLIVGAALAGDLQISGLQRDSVQADRAILLALEAAGVPFDWQDGLLLIQHSRIEPFHFDATECPDLFPPLVALAAYGQGTTTLQGAMRLTHKESNRALTLQEEFGKLGIRIDLDGDEMRVHGTGLLQAATVHSHHDHRIAMAVAVAALQAKGAVCIEAPEAIAKSYPDFFVDLRQLGVQCREEPSDPWKMQAVKS